MAEYIREVEIIIDDYHKKSPIFELNRKTALFNALVVFEDSCRLGATSSSILRDGIDYGFLIREQLDAINILVQWIFQECKHKEEEVLDKQIVSQRYMDAAKLLLDYAKPYSPICSAYISYSRKHYSAKVDEKTKKITFFDNPKNRGIVIADMMESLLRDRSLEQGFDNSAEMRRASDKLIKSIKMENGHIKYDMDEDIWKIFRKGMERQWLYTSELPEEWEFETFTIKDFKEFWISLATYCFIHMIACVKSGVRGCAVDDAVIIKTPIEIVQILKERMDVSIDKAIFMIDMLTYDSELKNNDIVYQPFLKIDDEKLALAPHLILSSRPERNLISLIHKLGDKSYFDNLTNLREGLMQDEIDVLTSQLNNVLTSKNKALPGKLPDVDYALWDRDSNTILVCELKWLIEADSTPEVFARISDLEHGCKQIEDILKYAENNCSEFCEKIFGVKDVENNTKIIGCVISKKGIRVYNSKIPVVSIQTLEQLLQQNELEQVLKSIESKQYLTPLQKNFEFGLQEIKYAGYTFEIPALIRENSFAGGTYKRNRKKIGRNDPCPCGSGNKYKKCCGI